MPTVSPANAAGGDAQRAPLPHRARSPGLAEPTAASRHRPSGGDAEPGRGGGGNLEDAPDPPRGRLSKPVDAGAGGRGAGALRDPESAAPEADPRSSTRGRRTRAGRRLLRPNRPAVSRTRNPQARRLRGNPTADPTATQTQPGRQPRQPNRSSRRPHSGRPHLRRSATAGSRTPSPRRPARGSTGLRAPGGRPSPVPAATQPARPWSSQWWSGRSAPVGTHRRRRGRVRPNRCRRAGDRQLAGRGQRGRPGSLRPQVRRLRHRDRPAGGPAGLRHRGPQGDQGAGHRAARIGRDAGRRSATWTPPRSGWRS